MRYWSAIWFSSILLGEQAAAQTIDGLWRTDTTDPDICLLISATRFADPLAEIDCRVTKRHKTGANTWTLSLACNIGGGEPEVGQQSESLYLRLLSPGRLRLRLGSAGPLMVYQRC